MREAVLGQGLDVIRDHVLPVGQRGTGLGCPEESQSSARVSSQIDVGMAAGCPYQRGEVLLDGIVHVDILDLLLHVQQFAGSHYLIDGLYRMYVLLSLQDSNLVGWTGIAETDAHQESVQLSFRQREGALVFDRVLRRQDEEWLV